MSLHLWSDVAHVAAALPGPARLDLYALKDAGDAAPRLLVEGYAADGTLVAGGELVVWELNQALAALLSDGSQARRLALRDDGRGHPGHLDVVTDGPDVTATVGSRLTAATATFVCGRATLAAELNAVLRHYLAMTRATVAHTIVLPDAMPVVLSGPVPAPH